MVSLGSVILAVVFFVSVRPYIESYFWKPPPCPVIVIPSDVQEQFDPLEVREGTKLAEYLKSRPAGWTVHDEYRAGFFEGWLTAHEQNHELGYYRSDGNGGLAIPYGLGCYMRGYYDGFVAAVRSMEAKSATPAVTGRVDVVDLAEL
jgi:hypothetical protein